MFVTLQLGLFTDLTMNMSFHGVFGGSLVDDSVKEIVQNVGNFTVFVKVDVRFDRFGVQVHYMTFARSVTLHLNVVCVSKVYSLKMLRLFENAEIL